MSIHIVVPGPPPRKNTRPIGWRAGKPVHITSRRTQAFRERFDAAWRASCLARVPARLAKSGRWSLQLDVYEKEQRHLDVDVPNGDVDSSITAVLDAMQRGIWAPLDDDARVVSVAVRKHYDKARPRVEITLTEIES